MDTHLTALEQPQRTPHGELWDSLTLDERARVRARLEAVNKAFYANKVTDALYKLSDELGESYSALRERYYKWLRAQRDWRVLMDKRTRKGRKTESCTRSPRFVAYFQGICLESQRSTEQAIDELYRRRRSGDIIPGYEDDMTNRNVLPHGWSRANLRRLAPCTRSLSLIRQGVNSAKNNHLMPVVYGSREQLDIMQYVMFDDVHGDHIIHHGSTLARPLILGCNDMLTGMRLAHGAKPRTIKGKTDMPTQGLTKLDMLQLVVGLLYTIGYNTQTGTTLIVENATAAISEETELLLKSITHGMVRVERSGLAGAVQVLSKGYAGQQGGNPRKKAGLETWHNPFHNLMAILIPAGNMGHNRGETAQEIIHGQMQEQYALIKQLDKLPSEVRNNVRHHLISWQHYLNKLEQSKGILNARTHHNLGQWTECGFELAEVRLSASQDWQRIDTLGDELKRLAYDIAVTTPSNFRARRMSPAEAWDSRLAQNPSMLRRLTELEVCELLAPHMLQKLPAISNASIKLRDKEMMRDIRYESCIHTIDGVEKELHPNKSYMGFLNPYDPYTLFVFDAERNYLGIASMVKAAYWGDEKTYHAAQGRANQRTAGIVNPLQDLLEAREAEVVAIRDHNKRVIAEAKHLPYPTETDDNFEDETAPMDLSNFL